MPQIKMRYGIDLGTTNSTICRIENGEPVVKKTDHLKDTLPSCVAFTRKKAVRVGDDAYDMLSSDKAKATKKWETTDENVFIEFKRTMGLNTTYFSSFMDRSFSSEELSAEVLKTLRSFVTDDTVNAAVITIPAKFKTDQISATKRAAKLAGIEHCELLQEPIAAAMAYGFSSEKKNAKLVVFDFGGGTFDAALIDTVDGIMQVRDTEGDNYLGGKNLDFAIVDEIIIPWLQDNFAIDDILADEKKKNILRNAMKVYAEPAKNQLSFKEKVEIYSQIGELGEDDEGNEIELDLEISRDQLFSPFAPIFQKAINITKKLLERNHLTGSDIDALILVGGPTHSSILRSMLKEQITEHIDTTIDPMTAVARGAALFSMGIDSEAKVEIAVDTVALDVAFEATTVEESSFVSFKLLRNECKGHVPDQLYVEVTRGDKAWSSGKVQVNEIGDIVECQLVTGRSNSFTITAYDGNGSRVPCFPAEFNIMQGMVVGNAVLPYHIGLEVHDSSRDKDVFVPLKGLEKNKAIPAVGVRNSLKVPHSLRPGISSDRLEIPIYQGEHNAEGTSAVCNDHVFDVVITGNDVPAVIPENSEVDITIKVDASQMMKLEAYFPVIQESVEKDVEVKQRSGVSDNELNTALNRINDKMRAIRNAGTIPDSELRESDELLSEIDGRYEGERSSEDGKMHLLADVRRVMLKLEEVEKRYEWETLEAELHSEMNRLEEADKELGNRFESQVDNMKRQVNQVIRERNPALARETLTQITHLFMSVTLIYQLRGIIREYSRNFTSHRWNDTARAHSLLSQGMDLVRENAGPDALLPVVRDMFSCLDEETSNKICM